MSQVLDYSGARPGGARIAGAGYVGVIRYLSEGGGFNEAKRLHADEIADLWANGLEVGLVWETTAARALAGRDAGRYDAVRAREQARSLGFPDTVPIYFAVDTDVRSGHDVDPYFAGVASVEATWGVYGEYDAIEVFRGRTPWLWQCAAWSGSGQGTGGSSGGRRLSSAAVLFQRVEQIWGGACDVNDVLGPWGGYHPDHQPNVPEEDSVTPEQMAQLGSWMQDQAKNVVTLVDQKIDALAWGIVAGNVKVLEAIKAVQAGEPVDTAAVADEIGRAVTDEIAKRLAPQ